MTNHWRQYARCLGADPELFYPPSESDDGGRGGQGDLRGLPRPGAVPRARHHRPREAGRVGWSRRARTTPAGAPAAQDAPDVGPSRCGLVAVTAAGSIRRMNAALWPDVIGRLLRRDDLPDDLVEQAMSEILSGDATDAQIAAFAVALRAKGETAAELAALVRTMLDVRRARRPDRSRRCPLVDTCGTGGDGAGTVNVSTMAAIVTAASGRAGRQARRSGGVVEVRVGRRARVARRRHRPRSRGREPLRARGRHRLLLRPALPSGDALRRAGAPRAGHADDLQLPRPARQPGRRRPAAPSACPIR